MLHTLRSSRNLLRSSYGLEKQLTFICEMAKEAVQGCQASIKYMYFLDIGRRPYVQDGIYLVGVGLDTPLGDQICQKFLGGHTEGALLRIEPDLVLTEAVK